MNPFDALVRPAAPSPLAEIARPRPRQANPVRTFGGRFPERPNRWNLSPVECEIMRLITEEWLTQNEVAARLIRGAKTIQTHCERIREKMGARNQYHAAVLRRYSRAPSIARSSHARPSRWSLAQRASLSLIARGGARSSGAAGGRPRRFGGSCGPLGGCAWLFRVVALSVMTALSCSGVRTRSRRGMRTASGRAVVHRSASWRRAGPASSSAPATRRTHRACGCASFGSGDWSYQCAIVGIARTGRNAAFQVEVTDHGVEEFGERETRRPGAQAAQPILLPLSAVPRLAVRGGSWRADEYFARGIGSVVGIDPCMGAGGVVQHMQVQSVGCTREYGGPFDGLVRGQQIGAALPFHAAGYKCLECALAQIVGRAGPEFMRPGESVAQSQRQQWPVTASSPGRRCSDRRAVNGDRHVRLRSQAVVAAAGASERRERIGTSAASVATATAQQRSVVLPSVHGRAFSGGHISVTDVIRARIATVECDLFSVCQQCQHLVPCGRVVRGGHVEEFVGAVAAGFVHGPHAAVAQESFDVHFRSSAPVPEARRMRRIHGVNVARKLAESRNLRATEENPTNGSCPQESM